MSLERALDENRICARFGRIVRIDWIQPREPYGGWTDAAHLEPEPELPVDVLAHDRVRELLVAALDDELDRLVLGGRVDRLPRSLDRGHPLAVDGHQPVALLKLPVSR